MTTFTNEKARRMVACVTVASTPSMLLAGVDLVIGAADRSHTQRDRMRDGVVRFGAWTDEQHLQLTLRDARYTLAMKPSARELVFDVVRS